jgi:hypothetical protein
VGKAPIDRSDLAAGQHYVVVRKQGFAEWKREVNLEAGGSTTLTAELSASGTLKVLSNVAGADVFIDGMMVGKTPLTLDNVAAGEHLVEVKKAGYADAKQPFRVDGGEQKILSADLVELRTGPTAGQLLHTQRSMSSWSAVTVEPQKFTFDLGGGFNPFLELRLTVGALRRRTLGLDAGVHLNSTIIMTGGGAHAKFQFVRAGPVAVATWISVGGGGGPGERNTFSFEFGLPLTLLFGDYVKFTLNPYGQVYSDGNCRPTNTAMAACSGSDTSNNTYERDTNFRLMLQGSLEIAVHQIATLYFIFEGNPLKARDSFSNRYSRIGSTDLFPWVDPQVYGRLGVTFKF